ncbi:hypothetical protein E1B28_001052 [Marasmius oreades]|uniref:Glycosyltransferase family 31 protein n=1 Tax=Marasmius oreades TaxID=181124 RepID=A0A9P7V2S3_9AGAR|nr:uncharacterized protein E1B28_001052 [Marasmius oreades]KAG7099183.1 hypothetical protein E1B28_001052 [Marasmius oreades]
MNPISERLSSDGYESSDSLDSTDTIQQFRLEDGPRAHPSTTPIASRSSSPTRRYYSSHSSASEGDAESHGLLARRENWREERRRWWQPPRRWQRVMDARIWRTARKWLRRLVRHPLFPRQPTSIILSIVMFALFAVLLTIFLMYVLNPDKEPLPWRAYCSMPYMNSPPDVHDPTLYSDPYHNYTLGMRTPLFPHKELELLPPAGILIGVFSTDSSYERRALVRSTWATHPRSRDGAGAGDNGIGTSRTIVRFIMGQPRKDFERRVALEIEEYNDIIVLPMQENMNDGKTHAFFSWAADDAWVPPVYRETPIPPGKYSYSTEHTTPPVLAPHDPWHAFQDRINGSVKDWVRPDFVVKMDDDAFVMLAELEARLRLELHAKPSDTTNIPIFPPSSPFQDPLIYWGYLVTNRLHRFMAGELYTLSWSLVDYVANDPTVRHLIKGKEDKQTAKWMKVHPKAHLVRWISERCWIHDHPRAGTVYAHGFLFPSEVTRIRRDMASALSKYTEEHRASQSLGSELGPTPASWAHSSVSTFHVRYSPPLSDLDLPQSIEALVEGSDMSKLREDSPMTPKFAWDHREDRKTRYEGYRVGGTVAVHFIKQNMWFLETALALLQGEDVLERQHLPVERNVTFEDEGDRTLRD